MKCEAEVDEIVSRVAGHYRGDECPVYENLQGPNIGNGRDWNGDVREGRGSCLTGCGETDRTGIAGKSRENGVREDERGASCRTAEWSER